MFRIDSNQTIKISKGDDVKFPLFLNRGTLENPIRYSFVEGDGCEIYFYVLQPNSKNENKPVLYKKFCTDGTIYTKRLAFNEDLRRLEFIEDTTDKYDTINENSDMVLRIQHEDTLLLRGGEYRYIIKAKIVDSDVEPVENEETGELEYSYIYNTITNKLPIYIIDDEIDRDWSN